MPLHSLKISETKRRLCGIFSKRSNGEYLTKLPNEILYQISDYLPASSLGCLALTSKTFGFLLPEARSILQLSSEYSMVGQTVKYPWQCQSQRYLFLRLLEMDINPHHFLCWDCFTLHPRTAFSKFASQSKQSFRERIRHFDSGKAIFMSCSRDHRMEHPRLPETLAGIVDLCPCIKLTPTMKRRIEAMLHKRKYSGETSLVPWHTCHHQYDHQVSLEIKIWLYLKYSTNSLMARVEYRRTRPSDWPFFGPRRYCPHRTLDQSLCTLRKCHNTHDENSTCANYRRLRSCSVCDTELIAVYSVEDAPSIMTTDIVCVGRCLSDQNWSSNAVYLPQPLFTNERRKLCIPLWRTSSYT